MNKVLKLEKVSDEYILSRHKFHKHEHTIQSTGDKTHFFTSETVNGAFLVVETIDDAIDVFPIIDGKIYPVSTDSEIISTYFATHFKEDGKYLLIAPTKYVVLDDTVILKRIRGCQTMTMHFGHFILDEMLFLRMFLNLENRKQLKFIGNYDKPFQISLLSYLLPNKLDDIQHSHLHTSNISGENNFKPSGIIRNLYHVKAPYKILRASITRNPYTQIGKVNRLYAEKSIQSSILFHHKVQSKAKFLLLGRGAHSQFRRRWNNAEQCVDYSAKALSIEFTILYPEEYDPIELLIKGANYTHIFSEPGSAIFLFLTNPRPWQHYFMAHPYVRLNNRHWPGNLVDFRSFSDILTLVNCDKAKSNNDWSTVFDVNPSSLLELIQANLYK